MMTVGELKAELSKYPDSLPVVIEDDYHWMDIDTVHQIGRRPSVFGRGYDATACPDVDPAVGIS